MVRGGALHSPARRPGRPWAPGPALPASVGRVRTRGDQAPPAGASPEELWTPRLRQREPRLLCQDTGRVGGRTPLLPQLLAPSPSPTPQGQRAAPEDQMACGHWPWPQVPAEKSIPASSWAGLSLA